MTEDERSAHAAAIAHAAKIAEREGCDTTKAGVLDVLARGGSFDVQACPGAGKTTVVATKIVVLLDGWRERAGICVLTHTNVAREEIQKRLRRSDVGRAALEAPHFVGTIQSFVDTFLALPYLRAKGIAVEQIDNDASRRRPTTKSRADMQTCATGSRTSNARGSPRTRGIAPWSTARPPASSRSTESRRDSRIPRRIPTRSSRA